MGGPEEFWKKNFLCADIDYIPYIYTLSSQEGQCYKALWWKAWSHHTCLIYFGEREFRITLETKKKEIQNFDEDVKMWKEEKSW